MKRKKSSKNGHEMQLNGEMRNKKAKGKMYLTREKFCRLSDILRPFEESMSEWAVVCRNEAHFQ